MTPIRRAGNKTALWNAAVTGVAGKSNVIELPRFGEVLALYITVNGATTVSLEAGSSADVNADGTLADTTPSSFFPVFYLATAVQNVFAGSGSACILVPDFVPAFIRLSSSASVTATAGWEMV